MLAIAAISLAACGPRQIFSADRPLPGYWTYADSVVFAYDIADTSLAYDLELTFDHSDAFAAQNLYAEFVTHYPGGATEREPVSIELADKRGTWLGECSGEDCRLALAIQRGARFPEPGAYGLTLRQYGRSDTLAGIAGIGMRVTVAQR